MLFPARPGGARRRYSDADIAQLQRIQRLTDDGLNLAGVKRVIELEAEVARLRQELADMKESTAQAIADVERQHRRDLVPVKQSVTVYQRRRKRS
ncbi:MAG: MerR family transcriptional regulator [Actinomycetota bacterium]